MVWWSICVLNYGHEFTTIPKHIVWRGSMAEGLCLNVLVLLRVKELLDWWLMLLKLDVATTSTLRMRDRLSMLRHGCCLCLRMRWHVETILLFLLNLAINIYNSHNFSFLRFCLVCWLILLSSKFGFVLGIKRSIRAQFLHFLVASLHGIHGIMAVFICPLAAPHGTHVILHRHRKILCSCFIIYLDPISGLKQKVVIHILGAIWYLLVLFLLIALIDLVDLVNVGFDILEISLFILLVLLQERSLLHISQN